MKNASEKYVVLTEKQIVQKMAGHKSAYTKLVKAARTIKERKHLESQRESYLGFIEQGIREENRKAIQRRAGHLSWITRNENKKARTAVATTPAKKSSKSTKKTCRCTVSKKH